MKEYTLEDICDACIARFEDGFGKNDAFRLAFFIKYLCGKGKLYRQFVMHEQRGAFSSLGKEKPYVNKLPILLEIFNKYCEFTDEEIYDGWTLEKTVRVNTIGDIPQILVDEINKEIEKYQREDTIYVAKKLK